MEFRTIVKPIRTDIRIDHRTTVIMLGSCFSDNIGRKLQERMFLTAVNPLGTMYNPASIAAVARILASGRQVTEDELFEHEGLWRHFMCHTSLGRNDRKEACEVINSRLDNARSVIKPGGVAVITLGTARVFEKDGMTVSNCHKLPGSLFTRRLMSVEESTSHILTAINDLESLAPGLRTILTVSPIRHMECGLDGNSLSKAVLRVACQNVCDERHGTLYFPSFEALTDDLRDYRFYEADMKHPTAVAVDYIYELFENSVMDEATRQLAKECMTLSRRLAHRTLNPDTREAIRFEQETMRALETLIKNNPELAGREPSSQY